MTYTTDEPATLAAALDSALDSAADIWIGSSGHDTPPSKSARAHAARVEILRAKMFAVTQDLPDDLTVRELRHALAPADWVAPEDDDD